MIWKERFSVEVAFPPANVLIYYYRFSEVVDFSLQFFGCK
jgi:hypothetical protein